MVAIKTAEDFDTLTWYLLSEGDVVSIYIDDADQQSETRTCLIPRCTVHSKLNETPSMIGVWLTERESKLVNDAQEQGVKMSLAGAE